MDEQRIPAPTSGPVVIDIPVTEPSQAAEVTQAPTEPISTPPETPQSEPTQTPTETPTPQMAGNEPLPEITTEPTTGGVGASAETPKEETPMPTPTPISDASPSEETHPKAEESAPTPPQTQQGTAQPEPTPPQESSVPAQAQTVALPQNILKLLLTKANLTIQLRKQKKLLKVMGLFAKKTHITNDDVEKLLHVSDATAQRYLTQLKKENKIKQIGKTGRAVIYTKY